MRTRVSRRRRRRRSYRLHHHLRADGRPGGAGLGIDWHERDHRLPSDAPVRTLAPHIILQAAAAQALLPTPARPQQHKLWSPRRHAQALSRVPYPIDPHRPPTFQNPPLKSPSLCPHPITDPRNLLHIMKWDRVHTFGSTQPWGSTSSPEQSPRNRLRFLA